MNTEIGGDEIDLCQCVKIAVKRKKVFAAACLSFIAIGFGFFLLSPRIYRISVFLYPPIVNEAFNSSNNSKAVKDLKSTIMDNSFNRALKERLKLDPKNNFKFDVAILDKSNILQVSVDLAGKEKDFGIAILKTLIELISENYAKRNEAMLANIIRLVKLKKRDIASAKKSADNLREQVKGIIFRENKLSAEKKSIAAKIAQLLGSRGEALKINAATEDPAVLSLAGQVQDNSNDLIRINNKLEELSLRKARMSSELKNINFKISNFLTEINKINTGKESFLCVKNFSQPTAFLIPVGLKVMRTSGLFLAMGVLSGMLAVFLREKWAGKLKKHD